jgi:hypothetical protein
LAIVLSVLLRYTVSGYSSGIFWPLCCLFFFDIQILVTPLVSSYSSSNARYVFYCLMQCATVGFFNTWSLAPICFLCDQVYVCYLYLFTYDGIQRDFHIRWCPCRLTVILTWQVLRVLIFPEHSISSLAAFIIKSQSNITNYI